jgi:hypothetical protein
MILHISRDMFVALRGVDDLASFRIECAAPRANQAELRHVLTGIVVFDDAGNGWVREDWLRRASPKAGDPAWQAALSTMIAYAAGKGGVDQGAGTIRAPIDWIADDPT